MSSFVLRGIVGDVFKNINKIYEAAFTGGDIFYEGFRWGKDPGEVTVARLEIPAMKTASLLVSQIVMKKLEPAPSQALYSHSPDGFEWGYSGSGPAQLGLAVLLDATGDEVLALKYHQEFKEKFVAGWGLNWYIYASQIKKWLALRQSYENMKEAGNVQAD
jgi:hypothetical protein